MSHRSFIVLAASVAALSIGPAANARTSVPAPTSRPAAASPAARPAKPIARADIVREINANYKSADTNGDGGLVQSEVEAVQARVQENATARFAKRREGIFRQLDTNKDGQLSLAEFNAGTPAPQLKHQAPAAYIQQFDANKDQRVSLTEFGAGTLANFDRLDVNRDGIVSIEEQQKARANKK